MRSLIFLTALLFAPASFAQSIEDLRWMRGCWRTEAPREAENGAVVTEVWIAPAMPVMLGYSYTVGEGAVQGWEQARIEMIDGWPYFVAMPNGGAPVRFRLHDPNDEVIHTGEQPDNFAFFENPAHDYPQAVVYMRIGNTLMAQISGAHGADRITFNYRRIRCSADLRP